VKQVLQWFCYVFAMASLLLGVMMLMAGHYSLGTKSILIGALIFLPVGYYFQIVSRKQPVETPVEAGD